MYVGRVSNRNLSKSGDYHRCQNWPRLCTMHIDLFVAVICMSNNLFLLHESHLTNFSIEFKPLSSHPDTKYNYLLHREWKYFVIMSWNIFFCFLTKNNIVVTVFEIIFKHDIYWRLLSCQFFDYWKIVKV